MRQLEISDLPHFHFMNQANLYSIQKEKILTNSCKKTKTLN